VRDALEIGYWPRSETLIEKTVQRTARCHLLEKVLGASYQQTQSRNHRPPPQDLLVLRQEHVRTEPHRVLDEESISAARQAIEQRFDMP
jgi:hypothetical protein